MYSSRTLRTTFLLHKPKPNDSLIRRLKFENYMFQPSLDMAMQEFWMRPEGRVSFPEVHSTFPNAWLALNLPECACRTQPAKLQSINGEV